MSRPTNGARYIGCGYVSRNGKRVLRVGLIEEGRSIASAYFLAYPGRGDVFTLYPDDVIAYQYGKHTVSMALVR